MKVIIDLDASEKNFVEDVCKLIRSFGPFWESIPKQDFMVCYITMRCLQSHIELQDWKEHAYELHSGLYNRVEELRQLLAAGLLSTDKQIKSGERLPKNWSGSK